MSFGNLTALNVEKVKRIGHLLVTTKYEKLAIVDFKHVAMSVEKFLTMRGSEKGKFLGSFLLSSWLIYVCSCSREL